MKKLNFTQPASKVSIIIALLFFSFNFAKADEVNPSIKLTSPSGKVLFKTTEEMNNLTVKVIKEKFSKNLGFEITDISYKDYGKGLVATVAYKLATGEVNNYLIIKNLDYKVQENKSVKILEQNSVVTTEYVMVCQGSCPCSIGYDYETHMVTCSCGPCVVRLIASEE